MDEQQARHAPGYDPDATGPVPQQPAGTPPGGGTTPFAGPPAGPAAPGAQHPTGWPSGGPTPNAAVPRPVFGPPTGFPGYAGAPATGGSAWPPPAAATPRRAGGVRIGMAGLVAGALIGGAAGAGTVALLDRDGAVLAAPPAAQEVVIENPETATTTTAAAAKAAPSVVTIYVSTGSGSGSGSGVVLTEDGFVLTNNHVVEDAGSGGRIQVRTADGTVYDAELVGTEPSADIAVVRIDGVSGLTPATFADSDAVQVGDVAVAIGAPLGLTNTVTDGIISATNRAVSLGSSADEATVVDALQTDAAINPGNSGGALVNAAGEVIGINTAIATVAGGTPGGGGQSGNIGVGFAVPSNTAERIATELIETGKARRALLGVSARTEAADGSAVGSGARVVQVEPGSAAADAGLRPGDVITAIDDRPVTTSTDLTAAVRSRTPGDEATLTVRRDGERVTVDVTLGSSG